MHNTVVINSTLPPNRGELLPFYYLFMRRFSQNAVFIHDTVFLNSPIDSKYLNTSTYHYLWTVRDSNEANQILEQRPSRILAMMDGGKELESLRQRADKWDICFGGMVVINLDFITQMFSDNNHLQVLIEAVDSRRGREAFERVVGVLLSRRCRTKVIHGNVMEDQDWLQNLDSCTKHLASGKGRKMYKVWLARYGHVKEGTPKKMGKANLLMKGNRRPVRKYKIWTGR